MFAYHRLNVSARGKKRDLSGEPQITTQLVRHTNMEILLNVMQYGTFNETKKPGCYCVFKLYIWLIDSCPVAKVCGHSANCVLSAVTHNRLISFDTTSM